VTLSSDVPASVLQKIALPVVLLTVGLADARKTIVTTATYVSYAPPRLAQTFPAQSATAKMVLERNRFSLSIASQEQLALVKSLFQSHKPDQRDKSSADPYAQEGLVQFPGQKEIYYFANSILAFDCEVEKSFQADDYLVIVSRIRGSQKGDGQKPLVRFAHGYASIDDTIFSDDPYPV